MNLHARGETTPAAYAPAAQKTTAPPEAGAKAFCEQLARRHAVSDDKIEELMHRARWLDEPIAELALREGLVTETELRDLLATMSGVRTVSLSQTRIAPEAVERVPATAVSRCRFMPVEIAGERIVLATDRIVDHAESEQLRILLGASIEWVLCTVHELSECIKHYYGVGLSRFLDIDAQKRRGDEQDGGAEASPGLTGFVEQLLDEAILANATDIHIEPRENALCVRYRIDGILYPVTLPAGVDRLRRALVSSIKVMAQLNIAERRLPQDGRFTRTIGTNAYDIRVSVLPSRHGETISLRILNRQSTFLNLDELGLSAQQRAEMENLIGLSNGLVLFTGPTGSGKTTSLYAALARLNTEERKIITLEDPVEYDLAGITQMQVQPEIGFSFPTGLRSILRHDPDVILIGEIRDSETASIAVGSALTGHLVLSTLHTQDAAGAVVRLMDMGIEPYLVSSSVQGMVAQRLLRRICRNCREAYREDTLVEAEARRLFPDFAEPMRFYRGRGCPACRFFGYTGRQAVFEVFLMNDELRHLVVERASTSTLTERALAMGLSPLRHNAWACALDGTTTVADVLRMTRRPAFHPDR